MIYGLDGTFVPNENLQNPELSGAIHNITQYLITYLVPGGPIVPINAIIAAVNDRNETAEVAAAFNKAVAAGYIPQLEALLKQVNKTSLSMTPDNRRMYELFAEIVIGSKADVHSNEQQAYHARGVVAMILVTLMQPQDVSPVPSC